VATGNWGSGCFGGDPRLKALLQWMAASLWRRSITYHPFGDARVCGTIEDMAGKALRQKMTVKDLYDLVMADPQNAYDQLLL